MEASPKITMRRRILGAVAATAAAPFLVLLLMYLAVWAREGFPWPLQGLPFSDLMLVGLASFFIIPIPMVTASLIGLGLAWLLERAGFRSRLPFMLVSAVIGLTLTIWLPWSESDANSLDWTDILFGPPGVAALAGALCGWIYWRIAIGRTPEGSRAIDPE